MHLFALSAIALAGAGVGVWLWSTHVGSEGRADPGNAEQVAIGREIYANHCASCHGQNLEGEPNWQQRKPTGRLPAPPHDASGHTWHHPDQQLFNFVKNGLVPYAPAGYQSDMPAFGKVLSDQQVLAVLAFIKNSWPEDIRQRQTEITHLSNR